MKRLLKPLRWVWLINAMFAMISISCKLGEDPEKKEFLPVNVSIEINDGAESARDTALRVAVSGEFIESMQIGADEAFTNAQWSPFDTLVIVSVPAIEGLATIYGRFTAAGGGTTAVLSDEIEIDRSARISEFNVSFAGDVLHSGDDVSFEMITQESGRAEVKFGRYYSDMRLREISPGLFRRTMTIPPGIIDDSVFCIAEFTDVVGNVAPSFESPIVLQVSGRALSPRLLGNLRIAGLTGVSTLIRGGVCFIADRNSRLHLVDVIDPEHPSYMKSIETSGWCGGMDATERLLYLADGNAGVAIVGIFPPNTSAIISRAYVSGTAMDVELYGDYVFVATKYSGLWVIDANDWIQSNVLARLQISGYGEVMTRHEETLYIAGEPSVAIIDVSDPKKPIILTEFVVDGEVRDLTYYEGLLFLATQSEGLQVYDVTDPLNPMLLYRHRQFVPCTAGNLLAPYLIVGRESSISVVNAGVAEELPVIGDVGGFHGVASMDVGDHQVFVSGEGWFYTVELYQ